MNEKRVGFQMMNYEAKSSIDYSINKLSVLLFVFPTKRNLKI